MEFYTFNSLDNIRIAAYQCYGSIRSGSYESRKKRGLPLEGICQTPMIPEWKLQMMANQIFRNYLADKQKVLDLANSMLEAHIADDEKAPDNTAEVLQQKTSALEKLNKKLDAYIEMRADGEISKDVFRIKTAETEKRIAKLTAEIEALSQTAQKETEVVDYREKLTVLSHALEQYTNFKEDEDIPDCVIEAFVEKIVVSKDGFDWYLRFDGDPNDPLRCKATGKKRSTTQISFAGENTPAVHSSCTGCDQERLRSA